MKWMVMSGRKIMRSFIIEKQNLLRKKKDVVRTDVTAVTKNLPTNDNRLIMPLPANTVNANRNMIQNPGY